MSAIRDYIKALTGIFDKQSLEIQTRIRDETFEVEVQKLTCKEDFEKAKQTLTEIPAYKRFIFLGCLRYGLNPEESIRCTDKIFIHAKNSYFTADDIFFVLHQCGTLRNLI